MECEFRCPDLLNSNQDAWELWCSVNTQWRMSAFSLVGLDYSAVFQVAEILGMEITPSLFLKIQKLEMKTIERFQKGAKVNE